MQYKLGYELGIGLLKISSEAKAMLDIYASLGTPLFGLEKSAMIEYVDAEVAAGNYTLRDYYNIQALAGVNATIDFKGGKSGSLLNGASQSINGFTYDGVTNQHFDSNFTPSIDGINYVLDNAQIDVFLYDTSDGGNNRVLLNSSSTIVSQFNAAARLRYGINTTGQDNSPAELFLDDTFYSFGRTSSTAVFAMKDGTSWGSAVRTSTALFSTDVLIGQTLTSTSTALIIGATIGIDQTANNANLRALLTKLGSLP